MTKKAIEISMNTLIICAIGIIVLVVISIIFLGRIGTFKQPFDVNKDVCTQWKYEWREENHTEFRWSPLTEEEYNYTLNHDDYWKTWNTKVEIRKNCLEWRPKSICESDPSNKDCICDKFKYNQGDSCIALAPIKQIRTKNGETEYTKSVNGNISGDFCMFSPINETFVNEEINHIFVSKVKGVKIDNECVQAHPKTIQDVSCQELKIAILKGYRYNTINNDFGEYPLCKNPDCIDTAQLVDIAIFRRCLSDSRLTIQITGDNP